MWEGQTKLSDEAVHEEVLGGLKVEDARTTQGSDYGVTIRARGYEHQSP
jgi:hypothetical protein